MAASQDGANMWEAQGEQTFDMVSKDCSGVKYRIKIAFENLKRWPKNEACQPTRELNKNGRAFCALPFAYVALSFFVFSSLFPCLPFRSALCAVSKVGITSSS